MLPFGGSPLFFVDCSANGDEKPGICSHTLIDAQSLAGTLEQGCMVDLNHALFGEAVSEP